MVEMEFNSLVINQKNAGDFRVLDKAWCGWRTAKEADRYLREANQRKLAENEAAAIPNISVHVIAL